MPVLPLVESRRIFPGASWPELRASATMRAAARSLTEPPGLCHSALPKRWMVGESTLGESRSSASSGNKGVLPMLARTTSPRGRESDSGGDGAAPVDADVMDAILLNAIRQCHT